MMDFDKPGAIFVAILFVLIIVIFVFGAYVIPNIQ